MVPQKRTVTVVEHTNPSSTFHRVVLAVDGVDNFEFTPGQFVSLRVAPYKVNEYSIASIPKGNQFELIVDIKPGLEGSWFIHELHPGDKGEIIAPCGTFQLHKEDGAGELVFLATGSGIAPLKAMTEQFLWQWHDQRPLHLYFGLRDCEDIFLDDYFGSLTQQFSNFKFTPCLSRPDIYWEGIRGHITDLFEMDYKDGSKLGVYLCGNKLMIEQAKELALKKGVPKERIYYEVF